MTKERKPDPHATREAEKYANPIPSREFIIDLLLEKQMPLRLSDLLIELHLGDDEAAEALRRRLKAMQRDGQLERLRAGYVWPVGHRTLLTGVLSLQNDEFCLQAEGHEQVYIIPKQNDIIDLKAGDRVIASIINARNASHPEVRLVEILDRKPKRVIGRFIKSRQANYVIPHSREFTEDILVAPNGQLDAQDGQIVVVEIQSYDPAWSGPMGRVCEVLGHENTPGIEIEAALRAHDIPFLWDEAVDKQIAPLKTEVAETDKQEREDYRSLPLITIDSEDARDFDDAVFCQPRPEGGWRLYVAIADVSHYVRPGSALNGAAEERATSVYFPGKVVPMLPEILSNELCSLKPQVDRLCMMCEMTISARGQISRYRFKEGVMRSHARLTYNKVASILKNNQALCDEYAELVPHIQSLHELYQVLHTARQDRGAIDFETTETRIIFGEGGKIARIEPVTRNVAHKIIEECMLCANVATARFLHKHKAPVLFRNHEGPTAEKLTDLKAFLQEMGLSLGVKKVPQPLDFAKLLKSIRERPDANIIQMVLLRSLTQAVYAPDNVGHFGLAYPAYCHFTSPIRRYPDLLVHRQIKLHIELEAHEHAVVKDKRVQKKLKEDAEALNRLGTHCSMAERRADDATRDVVRWLKCEYIKKHMGEEFSGLISGVTRFGFFVELKDIYIDGLVHISNIGGDYFHFDPIHHRLMGEHSGRRYQLGDSLQVRVARVDVDHRKIDFSLVEEQGPKPSKKSHPSDAASSEGPKKPKKKRPSKRRPKTGK